MAEAAASLFVVALPRSGSSLIYRAARLAVGLAEPRWTTDGEVLNVDRFAHYGGPRFDEGAKYTLREVDAERFDRTLAFLDDVIRPEGFAYKDVVQPFVTAAWLALHRLPVLKVRRPVAEVASSMLAQGWHYPEAAAAAGDRVAAVVEGLVRADAVIERLPGEELPFDELIADERHLRACLARLYPGVALRSVAYIDGAFAAERDRQLARRASRASAHLQAAVAGCRMRLPDLPPPAALPGTGDEREEAARRRVMRERVRRLACELLPGDAVVVAMAEEADGLLNLEGRRAWTAPATVEDLEASRLRGARYAIVPVGRAAPAAPPPEVSAHLSRYRAVHRDATCEIYDIS